MNPINAPLAVPARCVWSTPRVR